jgi:hypothetical protein
VIERFGGGGTDVEDTRVHIISHLKKNLQNNYSMLYKSLLLLVIYFRKQYKETQHI